MKVFLVIVCTPHSPTPITNTIGIYTTKKQAKKVKKELKLQLDHLWKGETKYEHRVVVYKVNVDEDINLSEDFREEFIIGPLEELEKKRQAMIAIKKDEKKYPLKDFFLD